jgi:polar amino acid transport system substrate-binding protein
MRFSLSVFLVFLVMTGIARAGTFKVATGDTAETRAIARVMAEAYRQLDIDIAVEYRPTARSFREVNAGKFDAELARTTGLETEYPNVVRVREPVYIIGVSAVVRSGSNLKITSWEDLAGLRVGYPRGYRILDVRSRDLQAIQAKDPRTIFKMLKGGRMDVGLLMTANANLLIKEFTGVSVLQPPIETIPLFHYVHIKHRRMIPALEKVLIEMNDSGRTNEILFGQ